jgi:hypothetical protein
MNRIAVLFSLLMAFAIESPAQSPAARSRHAIVQDVDSLIDALAEGRTP